MTRNTLALAALFAASFVVPTSAEAAGNVTVVQQGGNVKIVGDAAANAIDLSQSLPGELAITGTSGTTVNGLTSTTVAGVTGNVIINLRDGNDRVAALDVVVFPKSLKINLGTAPGAQFVFLNGVQVGRNLVVQGRGGNEMIFVGPHVGSLINPVVQGAVALKLGGGFNTANLDSLQVHKNLTYVGRDGNDNVALRTHGDTLVTTVIGGSLKIAVGGGATNSALIQSVQVGKNLVVSAKGGDDTVQVTEHHITQTVPTIGGAARIRLGDGQGTATVLSAQVEKQLKILMGDGFDQVNVRPSVFSGTTPTVGGSLIVELGDGTNFAHLLDPAVGGTLAIRGGADADSVEIADGAPLPNGRGIDGKTKIETAAGEDIVTIDQVAFAARVEALLGGDDDTLEVTDSQFDVRAFLDGGADVNTLTDTGNVFTAGADIVGF